MSGCSLWQPAPDEIAHRSGFTRSIAQGELFSHVVYEGDLGDENETALHVYIEGDGIPWDRGRYPASDPTPRRALALELMALDSTPAIYLGRPCYFGLAEAANCNVDMWTARRYSREIIDSMAAVIRRYQSQYNPQRLVLIGYSGGGTLATLLAGELSGDRYILTVAANLDTDLWTRQFGLLPLEGSLNPVNFISELRQIPQLHLVGGLDTTVPNNVTTSYTTQLGSDALRRYPDFDHSCCWPGIWQALLLEQPWASLKRDNSIESPPEKPIIQENEAP